MHAHPQIHGELARQRERDVSRRRRHAGTRSRQPDENASDDLGPLVRAARAGDHQAWELLVKRFTPTLLGVVRGYRLSPADAEDVVQTTWISAFAHIDRLRVPEAFAGWLLVTARRAALRVLEDRRREVAIDHECLPEGATDSTVESALLDEETRTAVHAAVDRLPGRQGKLVSALLRSSGGSYAEIADKLGVPLGSIGPTRERALARLRHDRQLIAAL
jgi:RNA polymerase sigma factor (sigma-70 family)